VATEAFPDFMFRASRRVVVADAKYKLGGGSVPSSSDGYQLFAYSHLATMGAIDSDLALILCPLRVGDRPQQFELERMRDRAYPLWFLRLPFPSRTDIQSRSNWSAYQGRLTRIIREFSTEWRVRRDERSAIA
jgi:5-methylcytosine-specific restriction endonuclease McrBC regulatory subunit McrC